jgi:ribose transport system substrate-binding protein
MILETFPIYEFGGNHMIRFKRGAHIASLVAVAALTLSACSSSDDAESTDAAATETVEESPSEEVVVEETTEETAEVASGEFVEFRGAEPGSGEGITLGIIALDDSIPFSKSVSDGFKEQAEIAGATLIFCDSKLDAATALACVKNFEAQGVQGYMNFQPVADAGQEICDAGPQGVPVIAIDIAQGDCQTAFMGANNARAGFIGGEGLGNWVKENWDCKIDAWISLEDFGVGSVNDARMDGQREGFESVCGPIDEATTQIRELDAGRQDIALTAVTDTLTALPDASRIAVVAINDDGISAALAAARTAGREDQIAVSGMGVDKISHCEIASGGQWAGSAAFFPERYGEIGIPYLIDAVNGVTSPKELLVDHLYVTKNNIGEFYDVSGC